MNEYKEHKACKERLGKIKISAEYIYSRLSLYYQNAVRDMSWLIKRVEELEVELDIIYTESDEEMGILIDDLTHAKRRIKALEAAAKSCYSCIFYNDKLEDSRECKKCRATGLKYGGWIFDIYRFTDKAALDSMKKEA